MSQPREWLVYSNTTYYPWAEIIEAASAEEAASYVDDTYETGAIIVVPFDQMSAFVRETWDGEIESLRKDGRERKEDAAFPAD